MADGAAIFRRPFAEQIAAFRLRLDDLRPTRAWTDLWQAEHDRAFMVAGALKADLLADLSRAVQRAIEDGTGIEKFRAEFREIVERRGWHGWTGEGSKRGEAWRTKVIYKTNMATTYAAGRWAQLMAAGYPLLVYRHGGSLDPRIQHLSWDGLILPVDHPFWQTHAPPNGWGCSCFVTGARSERDAVRKGGKPGKTLPEGWAVLNPKTGAPNGIDRGWAYAPGATVAETIATIAGKIGDLPAPISGALAGSLPSPVAAPPPPAPTSGQLAWQDWPKVKKAADAVNAALSAGVADEVIFRPRTSLAGVDQILRTAAEVIQRMGLPKLRALSDARDLPVKIKVSKSTAAFYMPAYRAFGVVPKSTNPASMAIFDTDDAPSEVAKWHSAVAVAGDDIRRRAAAMQARGQSRRWAVVRDLRSMTAHELGHHFHEVHRAEINALLASHSMMSEGWHLLISRYAGTKPSEFVAEAFALYISGDAADHDRIHPALLAFFKSKDLQK